jgi:hypothetical protein
MRIFLLGATPRFDLAKFPKCKDKLSATGHNSGNQVIAHGLLNGLDYETVEWDYTLGTDYARNNFDRVIVAAANFIHPSFDLGGMAAFIESVNLPCSVLGLGAQSKNFDLNMDLKPGTKRFLYVIKERCISIGVRGEFTAELLNSFGISNVEVIGCPSYYMAEKPEVQISKKNLTDPIRVAINLSRDVICHSFAPQAMMKAISQILRDAMALSADYILQTEQEEMLIAEGEATDETYEKAVSHYHYAGLGADLKGWMRKSVKIFWEPDRWIEAMSNYDFVIGQRFHGNICALRAGVPAFFVCHDSRTQELCQFLGLPHCDLRTQDLNRIENIYDLLDFSMYESRYRELYPRYKLLLEKNQLKNKFL